MTEFEEFKRFCKINKFEKTNTYDIYVRDGIEIGHFRKEVSGLDTLRDRLTWSVGMKIDSGRYPIS